MPLVQELEVGVAPRLQVPGAVVLERDAVVVGLGLAAGHAGLGVLVDVVAEVHDHVEVRRGERPVRLVRLQEAPFTDRLVAKFGLPVEGWRGSAERRRRSEAGGPA